MKSLGPIIGVLLGIIALIWWELRPTGKGLWDLVTRPSEVLGILLNFWASEIRGIALLFAVGAVWWLLSKAHDRWRAWRKHPR